MKNIIEATDEERKKADKRYQKASISSDKDVRARFDRATDLVNRLGLGGLWKGYMIGVMTIYDSLVDEKKTGIKPTCPDCESTDIFNDYQRGELICKACGSIAYVKKDMSNLTSLAKKHGMVAYNDAIHKTSDYLDRVEDKRLNAFDVSSILAYLFDTDKHQTLDDMLDHRASQIKKRGGD